MLSKYIRAAMERAEYSRLENGSFYAEIPGIQGVWADGVTREGVARLSSRTCLKAGSPYVWLDSFPLPDQRARCERRRPRGIIPARYPEPRRGGRVVDGTALEKRQVLSLVSSNLTLSAHSSPDETIPWPRHQASFGPGVFPSTRGEQPRS
jgi:hypothetical protein